MRLEEVVAGKWNGMERDEGRSLKRKWVLEGMVLKKAKSNLS